MSYKLKSVNGEVEAIMKCGSAFTKVSYPVGKCEGIIAMAKSVESSDRFPGYEICTNGGEFYFAGKFTADKPSKAEKTEEVKKPVTTAKKKKV